MHGNIVVIVIRIALVAHSVEVVSPDRDRTPDSCSRGQRTVLVRIRDKEAERNWQQLMDGLSLGVTFAAIGIHNKNAVGI